MANNNFKNDKFVDMIQEFLIVKGQNTYAIGELDLTNVYFFVKNENENYKVLATGQFQVVGANLVINDPLVIEKNTNIQVCRVLEITASKYISDIVNINNLKDHYNTLVDDFIKIIDFLRKSGIKSDSSSMNYVFPLLEEGQVFMKKGLGFEGKQIMDINAELQRQIDIAITFFEKYITEEKHPQLDEYVNSKKLELDVYTRVDKKNEIDIYVASGKTALTAQCNIELDKIKATGIDGLVSRVTTLETKTTALETGTTNLPKLTLCGYTITVE